MHYPCSQRLPRIIHRGVLSIEMVIILAVIAIMTVYVFSNSGGLFRKNDIMVEVNNVQEIITNAQTYLKIKGQYPSQDFAKILRKLGGIPPSMHGASDDSNLNVWGGKVTVEIVRSQPNHFSVKYEGVPQDACTAMAQKLLQAKDTIQKVDIGGTPITKNDISAIFDTCASAGPGPKVMTFTTIR